MIYFTSDHHFWHNNVIRYCGRPFKDIEEMNEMLIKNWNDVVGPDDIVYVLGDFSMAARPVEIYTKRLMGCKLLVPGNHDFVHSYNKKSRNPINHKKWLDKYAEWGWEILPEQTTFTLGNGTVVNVCHLPYTPIDDKYAKWRLKDDGKWLLCGHVHEKWQQVGRMINVGVDVWDFKPVSLETLEKIICGSNIVP